MNCATVDMAAQNRREPGLALAFIGYVPTDFIRCLYTPERQASGRPRNWIAHVVRMHVYGVTAEVDWPKLPTATVAPANKAPPVNAPSYINSCNEALCNAVESASEPAARAVT